MLHFGRLQPFSQTLKATLEKLESYIHSSLLRIFVNYGRKKFYNIRPRTPFSKLGQSPEGCSSYLFPKLMGSKRANEILLLDGVLTSGEAKQAGLVTEVFPAETFLPEVSRRLQEMSKLPPKTMAHIKKLVRDVEREKLHQGPILYNFIRL